MQHLHSQTTSFLAFWNSFIVGKLKGGNKAEERSICMKVSISYFSSWKLFFPHLFRLLISSYSNYLAKEVTGTLHYTVYGLSKVDTAIKCI